MKVTIIKTHLLDSGKKERDQFNESYVLCNLIFDRCLHRYEFITTRVNKLQTVFGRLTNTEGSSVVVWGFRQ